ncbi:hypothetical protein A3862_04125 [Methylobacterium sp. XJLW]|uniref:DUF4365 domain-containing protein n=1 Tax=Methylobacterium sp. XJLW TaxID=739141 RepID=UPI000DAAF10C|nr:DUF4365 domain-containing protein [Methylobacterium sp. XJLW]AWV14786.1 hypothetical protein A3862_04125 [Methylobacterium sp. XJLW]
MITLEHAQEAISLAYVHALAGAAGLNLAPPTTFDYGIDGTFHPVKNVGGRLIQSAFPVEFQMKSTTVWRHEGDHVVYDLSARAHHILTDRERGQAMAILILLCMPPEAVDWVVGSEEHLHLRRCCYWYRPPGPPTENTATVRIRIPRTQVLTADSLRAIMATARAEALAL